MHVALHRCHHDLALGLVHGARSPLLLFHVREQVRHGLLHRARALHDLRKEHFAGAEEVADDFHSVHQWPFDHVEGARQLQPGLFDVGFDEVDHAMDERVGKPLLHGGVAPGEIVHLFPAVAFDGLGELHEPFRRIRAAIEDHVLDVLEQILRNVLVDDQLAGVDNPHVEARLDRVEKEGRMDGLAHEVVAAEREREVADAAADLHARARRFDDLRRLDEVDRVLVVLFEARGDREDVGIEDDVVRIESSLREEQRVGALTDRDLPGNRVGLPLLVERHHDHCRAVPADGSRLPEKILFAFLEADGVDDPLALDALQPGFEHAPLRAVDHDRQARDLGLGGDQVQERRHGRFRVEHPFVHVDVEDVRAAPHLVERDVRRFAEVSAGDQPRKSLRAGHVGPLADHHEVAVGTDRQGLEAGELGELGGDRGLGIADRGGSWFFRSLIPDS